MKKKNFKGAAALVAAAAIFGATTFASAFDLGDLLKKGAGIVIGGFAVDAIAPQLDSFINTITFNNNAKFEGSTKVVPIVSIGDGTHIGAAQVGGTKKGDVDKVKAVAQLEGDWQAIRARALIPIDSENPLEGIRRVPGVGVTAIIDVNL